MATQNGETRFAHARHFVDERLESLKTRMHELGDRALKQPDGEPTRAAKLMTRAGEAIKAHPYLAIGIAIGLGYAVMRLVRR